LNDSFGGVSKNELVYAKVSEKNRANACRDLFVGTHRFPISDSARVYGLHWLISGIHLREWRLTIRTVLRHVIVNGAALGAVSAHLYNVSERGLRVCEDAKASNDECENQIAAPDKDTQTKKDETEEFGFLRGIQCT